MASGMIETVMPIPMLNTETQLCAVIGNPVAHSVSPHLHNAAFAATGLNYVYLAFRVEDLQRCLDGMRALSSFIGLSVTIPHKRAVMDYLDEIIPMARHVGSVNTITQKGGRLIGSTTDGLGALRAFEEAGISLKGRHVLFVGTGGAARSVAFAMAEPGQAASITILGRTPERVSELVNDLRGHSNAVINGGNLDRDLVAGMQERDVIIQATPVGMFPETVGQTVVPGDLFRPEQVAFDMVYRPVQTRFLQDAQQAGCRVVPGTEMLLYQAALQFETWTGVGAPIPVMRNALLKALTDED